MKGVAGAQALGRTKHYPPVVHRVFFEEEEFDDAAGAWLDASQPGRDHLRIVQDKEIAGCEEIRELGETAVFNRATQAVEHQEPRSVTGWGGVLGDKLGR